MAERTGFEPARRCRQHAFQACALNHSATSPYRMGSVLQGSAPRRKPAPRPFSKPRIIATLFRVAADGVAHKIPVTYGLGSIEAIQVLAGLQEGDQVVLGDSALLQFSYEE